MKIKLLSMALFYMGFAFSSFSQMSDAEADAVVNLLGVQKKEAMGRLVSVSGQDSVAFWKIYDEYLQKNFKIAKSRIMLYEHTVMSYGGMSAATADSLAARYFDNRISQEKSLEEYYKKIKAATNAVVAFEFYQAEVYLLTQIRAQIMEQIPTYGQVQAELKKAGD